MENRPITVIQAAEPALRPGGTVRFEGEAHGAGSSFFHVRNAPGAGAARHVHPYPETWLVLAGRVRFTVGGQRVEAGPGEIVVAAAQVPHEFVSLGPERLEMVCMHPSPRIIQEDLAEQGTQHG